jgi:hypothetical protein
MIYLLIENWPDNRRGRGARGADARFAVDSPLEEDGFEPSVPLAELSRGTKGSNPSLSR